MFLSIKRHLDDNRAEFSSALLQLGHSLLHAMRLQAVRGAEPEGIRFQAALLELDQRLGTAPGPSEVLAVAGEAAKTFEEYGCHVNRFHAVQSAELTTMIGMLTATVSTISAASQAAVDQLSTVERRIEQMHQAEDLILLKQELADCLAHVRAETFRQREQTSNTIHSLQRGVSDSRQRLAEVSPSAALGAREPLMRDALTKLPARADAEDALMQTVTRRNRYVAVLPVDRLALIHERFGPQGTDDIVRFFCGFLREHLHPEDELFRWSSNAFVALLVREQPQDSVRADLSRFASAKLEYPLLHHGREILLPVSSSWVLFHALEFRTHAALLAKIDGFLKNDVHRKDTF